VQCVGDPPRQNFAAYAAPCRPAFIGDNGGATSPGVSASEVRFAVSTTATSYEGPVPATEQPGENDADRTFRVLQEWFNRNYVFSGRRLQLIAVPGDTEQEVVTKAAEDHDAFGLLHNGAPGLGPEAGLVTFTDYRHPGSVYQEHSPYLYTNGMDNTRTIRLGAQYFCNKLRAKPPEFTDDPDLRPPLGPDERTFGVLYYAADEFARNGPDFEQAVDEECGLDVLAQGYTLDGESMATAITNLSMARVTTVAFLADFVTGGRVLSVGTAQQYFPEWVVLGFGGVDVNFLAATMPPEQWVNAFGITSYEIPIVPEATDWYRAYKEIDPDGEPDAATAEYLWLELTQFANGVQMAGPTLTPQTFQQGLYAMGRREPMAVWAVGGGFARGDHSYVDDVGEIWWDPSAAAYRFTRGGQRYDLGEIDSDTSELFVSGITEAPAG
jgi:hypothetical protein